MASLLWTSRRFSKGCGSISPFPKILNQPNVVLISFSPQIFVVLIYLCYNNSHKNQDMMDRWCSILVVAASFEGGAQNPSRHIDEVPGAGFRRPVGGLCWELRMRGDLQWHVGVDPSSAEAQVRGIILRL